MDRDNEVHRLTARLRALRASPSTSAWAASSPRARPSRRTSAGSASPTAPVAGCSSTGALPAAEPFFGATHGNPMGLASRRRYRWTRGRVNDYWDEVFTPDGLEGHAALDDQSAFIASLGSSRSARMRDVLSTIQADQDAIVRAGSRGALVVDGGRGRARRSSPCTAPPTSCTPTRGSVTGGVACCSSVRTRRTWRTWPTCFPASGRTASRPARCATSSARAARRSRDRPGRGPPQVPAEMVRAIEPAVRLYEEPPTEGVLVETAWSDIWLSAEEWAEAFASPDPGTPHNGRASRSGTSCSASWSTSTTTTRSPPTRCAGRWRGTPSCAPPHEGLAAARGRRRGRGPVVGAGVPADVRTLADTGRGPAAAQGGPACLDGVRPAAPGRGPAAARRPRGVPPRAPPRRGRRSPAGTDGRGRGRADHQRRLRDARDVHAARRRPARSGSTGALPSADPDLLADRSPTSWSTRRRS